MNANILFVLLLIVSSLVYGNQPPSIVDVEYLGADKVKLLWRDNCDNPCRLQVLRKSSNQVGYSVIDTVSSHLQFFNDTIANLATYYYALKIANGTDTSDADSITIPTIFVAPSCSLGWDADRSVTIRIFDKSNTESKYVVSRYNGQNDTYATVKQFDQFSPIKNDTLSFCDSDAKLNEHNTYRICVYNDGGSLCLFDSVYTLRLLSRGKIRTAGLVSRLGIRFENWCIKNGDSLYVNELGLPESLYTIVDVANPKKPRIAGFGRSELAVTNRTINSHDDGFVYIDQQRMVYATYENDSISIQSEMGSPRHSAGLDFHRIDIADSIVRLIYGGSLCARFSCWREDTIFYTISNDTFIIGNLNKTYYEQRFAHAQYEGYELAKDDTSFRNAKVIFFDTTEQLVFVIKDSSLSIYEYETSTTRVHQPARAMANQMARPKQVFVNDLMGRRLMGNTTQRHSIGVCSDGRLQLHIRKGSPVNSR